MAREGYERELKEYKISRDTVQLVNVDTVSMSLSKIKPLNNDSKRLGVSIAREIIDKGVEPDILKGIVRMKVEVFNEEKECCAVINVVQMGIFRAEEELDAKDFFHRVDLQLVPQLISYLRSTVSVLAAEAGLAPIVLPTMDVLQSIRRNGREGNQEA